MFETHYLPQSNSTFILHLHGNNISGGKFSICQTKQTANVVLRGKREVIKIRFSTTTIQVGLVASTLVSAANCDQQANRLFYTLDVSY